MSLNTFISVLADARVLIGLLQPHVDVVDVRHRQVEQRAGGGSGSGATWRDYYAYCEDERRRPINGRKDEPH